MSTAASNVAPGSLTNVRHRATAASHAAPCGARGLCLRYSKVISSGAIMPARAPASMDMLQMVIRSSMDRPRIVEPRYSST